MTAQLVGQPWARRNLARQIKGDQLRPDDRQANDAAAREVRGKRKKERKITMEEKGGDGRTLVENRVKKRGEIAVMSTVSDRERGRDERQGGESGRESRGRKKREDKREREGECRRE